ncbi:MAG: hypothetical protein D6729_02100 [Deltaproteobacteria bacterium]|nr:MAG: hypothetical protein D6729_02100 [Deltaproteobacteria bacterium]
MHEARRFDGVRPPLQAGGLAAVLALTILSCSQGPAPQPDGGDRGAVVLLSPTDRLIRATMALAGVRPTVEELRQVQADPDALGAIVDRYLDSPGFAETLRDLHNEALLMRTDLFFYPAIGPLSGQEAQRINTSLHEAPLKLIEYVVMHDRPYTEILTADYTVADGVVAAFWGLEHPGGPDSREWVVTHWPDGRPAAGVLSSSILWGRHMSAGFNFNRGRANLVARTFLCHDYLKQDVPVDGTIDLSDPEAVSRAVEENETCAGCHQTLDPLASYFFGFDGYLVPEFIQSYPYQNFRAEQQDDWRFATGRAPGYFGARGATLADLGRKIAGDPRFSLCTARRFFAYFAQMEPEEVPLEVASELQQVFVASGYDAKALAKAAVLHDALAVSHSDDPERAETLRGYKKVRPEQYARMVEDLTGFRWETEFDFDVQGAPLGRVDLARSDLLGFRTLAGGIDSYYVTTPTRTMNASTALFVAALASEAAEWVVDSDFALPAGERKLLSLVEEKTTDEAAVRAQIAALHTRIYGTFDDPESIPVTETYSLFRETHRRSGDVRRAWKVVVAAMLQDLRSVYY